MSCEEGRQCLLPGDDRLADESVSDQNLRDGKKRSREEGRVASWPLRGVTLVASMMRSAPGRDREGQILGKCKHPEAVMGVDYSRSGKRKAKQT